MAHTHSLVADIDTHSLIEPVRRALQRRETEVLDWSATQLTADTLNPATAGIYRVTGTANADGEHLSWSLVLKIIHWEDWGPQGVGYWNTPADWNYWKREALVAQSGILDGPTGPLVPAECYGVVERDEHLIWLWFEDVQERSPEPWSLERHVLAAQHFGEFNGAYAVGQELPADTWLCRQFLRQWVASGRTFGAVDALTNSQVWAHPLTQCAFPRPVAQRVLNLFEESDGLLDVLDRLPRTLSHHDAHLSNLFTRHNSNGIVQTAVIDWSFLGLAAVGEDLGAQVGGNLIGMMVDPVDAPLYEEAAFAAYVEGLAAAGWRGDERAVRYAATLAAVLRYGVFFPTMLPVLGGEPETPSWAEKLAVRRGEAVEQTMRHWGEAISFLLDRLDEARRLAGVLS